MKVRDTVQFIDGQLMVSFGRTGQTQAINLLRDPSNLQLRVRESSLYAECGNQSGVVVETFTSPALAQQAFALILKALRKKGGRGGARSGWVRCLLPWIIAPLLILAVLEVMYFMFAPPMIAASTPLAAGALPEPANVASPSTARAAAATPAQFASALRDAVDKGGYSVALSSAGGTDPANTIYLFEDPHCIFCRKFHPQVAELSKRYTVHVFPVSVIGGEESARIDAALLCREPAARAASWTKVMQDQLDDPIEVTPACQAAVIANDQVFRGMQFYGTPTILNGNGVELPSTTAHKAEAIDAWMRTSGGAVR